MTPEAALALAVEVARQSPCAKSQRGVVLFRDERLGQRGHREPIAVGFNAPPQPFACDGSAACRGACNQVAVHAEQAALMYAAAHGRKTDQAEMLHVKVVDGVAVPSGGPSCWQCSRLLLEAGVAGMWLLHEDGLRRYDAITFHRLTLESCGLPGALADQAPPEKSSLDILLEGFSIFSGSVGPFGGRRRGSACGCGGTLEATRHEGVSAAGWTLDCTNCDASYREDGAHWCPKCETWPDSWSGGTDSDPRPWCGKCGGDQPGWPSSSGS